MLATLYHDSVKTTAYRQLLLEMVSTFEDYSKGSLTLGWLLSSETVE